MRHARNETLRDRIRDRYERDRHGAGGLLDHHQVGRRRGKDHVRHQPDQLRRIDPCEFGVAGVPANVDAAIVAFGPSQPAYEPRLGRSAIHSLTIEQATACYELAEHPGTERSIQTRRANAPSAGLDEAVQPQDRS
jgi:hypothetical protein